MGERHIIDENGNYVVQIFDVAPIELSKGSKVVPPRPESYYEWKNNKWVENASLKYSILSEKMRSERDFLLLTEVDPMVTNPLRWADLSESQRQAVIDYRRSLLDITDQPGFPETVVWPTKP
jgi:hypothetical protein